MNLDRPKIVIIFVILFVIVGSFWALFTSVTTWLIISGGANSFRHLRYKKYLELRPIKNMITRVCNCRKKKRNELAKLGNKDSTFDQIISNLIKLAIQKSVEDEDFG